MELPAFRGSTIVTTALVHSSSPPGFVADEKDLSPNGRVKPHNGCVVRQNDKIILLKRVYTSPVRRSSRVRRKGCAVLHRSKVKHRHSDPAEYPKSAIRTTKHFTRSYPKSAGTTPVRTKNRGDGNRNGNCPHATPDVPVTPNNPATPSPTKLDFTSPDHITLSDNLTEADFFRLDGTPKRRLVVRITETPEIKKKLAEISRPQFSTRTELSEMLEKDRVSRDKEDALSINPLSDDDCSDGSKCCEDFNNQRFDIDPHDVPFDASDQGKSKDNLKDFIVGKKASAPERRPLQMQQAVPTDDSLLEFVLDSESSSSNSLDMELDDYQTASIESALNGSGSDVESINGSDDLKDTRDHADEVLCISPLPFETSDSAREQFPLPEGGESHRLHLGSPEFLPIDQNESLDAFMVTPEHSSSDESETFCEDFLVEDPSVSNSAGSSVSSRSPVTIVDTHLDERNQFNTSVSPASQKKLQKLNCLPPVNGMRDVSVMRVSLSPSAFVPVNRIDTKVFDSANLLDDVCIVNLTPSHKVYNNMKGKEPSPTYASQANSESPCSPGNTSYVSKHTEPECCGQRASSRQSPLKTKSCVKSPSPGVSSKIFPNHHDDFQDFSEFDFSSAQGPLLPQTFSPVEVTQKLSDTGPRSIPTKSPSDEGDLERNSSKSQFSGKSSTAEETSLYHSSPSDPSDDVNLTMREQAKCSKWIEMLESDEDYHEKSSQKGVVPESEEQWMSASYFLMNEHHKPSGKKKSERTVQRRSSMRIAKRMSLLTLEADIKNTDQTDADDSKQAEVSEVHCSKTSEAVPKQRKGFVKENMTVVRRRGRPPSKRPQVLDGASTELDKGAENVENSSSFSGSAEEIEKTIPQVPSSFIPTGLNSDEKLQCQFDTDCTVAEDHSKPKKKAVKKWDRQSRRCSARLNPIILPLISKSPSPVTSNNSSSSKLLREESELCNTAQPLTNPSCSDPVSTEEEFQCQFDDVTDPVKTKPKTKKPHKQPRRRSSRLVPIVLPLSCESPTANASDLEDMTSKSDDLDRVSSNSKSAESTSVSAQSVSVNENSECFSVAPVPEGTETDSTSASECIASSGEEERTRDKGKRRRRRSARLLQLSMISLDEDQSAMDQTLLRIPSDPEKGNTDINGEGMSIVGSNSVWSDVEEGNRDTVTFDGDKAKTDLYKVISWNGASYIPDEMSVDVDTQSTTIKDLPEVSGSLDDAITVSGEDANPEKRPRRRKSSVLSYSEKTKESKLKKYSKTKEETVKQLYLKRGENKPLKPNNLETIFEELHFSKIGSPLYSGSRKCKRAVNFPEHPWLPRKKKKTPNKSGRSKGKKKTSKDPNIDKKLEALLAEWTPASPASSSASSDYQADDPSQHCDIENGSSISQSDSDNSTYRSSLNPTPDISLIFGVNKVAHVQQAENPVPQKLRLNGEMGELEETSPKKPKRDTPFKGSGPSGSYGALLNRLMKKKRVVSRVGEIHDEAVQE
ncbi:uncharacterized protein LOC119730490 [Patiria miniata]|uniref:Uncharacterized protein n=1 Tax=Patiria miniata TaxID=46514 RepID=A0A914A6D8_PATMI|nr:uncharacterized protein LOC119730490 [Patiria miniata]XP_038059369.1 uncharacterized protein LOC119730490 [Patiria miniata]